MKGKTKDIDVLSRFWGKFKTLRTVEGKLALLREMAEIELPNFVPYKRRRAHRPSKDRLQNRGKLRQG